MNRFFLCFLSCVFCLVTGSVCAKDSGSSAYLAEYAVDWKEAKENFADCQSGQKDSHLVLGDCPSLKMINAYYITSAAVHFAATKALPRRYAKMLEDSRVNFNFSVNKEFTGLGVNLTF